MDAKVSYQGDCAIVQISGKINLEKTPSFKSVVLKNFKDRRVVFCLQQLQFVGSSGIQNFFKAVSEISQQNKYGVKLSGVNADFMRLLQFGGNNSFQVFENIDQAIQSFQSGSDLVSGSVQGSVSQEPQGQS